MISVPPRRNDQIRTTPTPVSLCHTCAFVRLVRGRRGQTYYLCRNDEIPLKYPPQPVTTCPGYAAATPTP